MGDLFGDTNLFGEPDIDAARDVARLPVSERRVVGEPIGQRYIPFEEPPVDSRGQQLMFAGQVLVDNGYKPPYRA